jgi:hypothetical protein
MRLYGHDNNGSKIPKRARRKGKVSQLTTRDTSAVISSLRTPPPAPGKYMIVHESETIYGIPASVATPLFWVTADDTDASLLELINHLPTSPNGFTNLTAAIAWAISQDFMIIPPDTGEQQIPGGNIVLYFDPSKKSCYPGDGNILYDLSGNDNNATLYNSPIIQNGYIEWNGTNEYAQIPFSATMAGWSNAQTVAMWLNHSYTSGRRNPWDQAYGGYGTWTHEQGNNINNYYGDAGRNAQPYTSNNSGTTERNQWNFLVTTRNTSQHKWYVNGNLISTQNHGYSTLTTDTNVVRLAIGYAGYWQGKMGPIIAYDRDLTEDEIKQLFLSSPFAYSTCKTAKEILQLYPELAGKDGYYWVWPDGTNPIRVWCDMTTDGGGWMLVARSHATTVNYNGTNWGWRGQQIGHVSNFDQAYQIGWEYFHNNGATFTEFIFGNRSHYSNNNWGPFIYKNSGINYTTFITSNTQQSYTKSVIKYDTSIYGQSSYPFMQNAVGFATSGTNSNLYYLRDCCGFAGYGGTPTGFNTAYRNSNSRYGSGPWGRDAAYNSDMSFVQTGVYYGSYLHGGTNQYMIMVR